MSEQLDPTHGSLDEAIAAFHAMSVPVRPPDAAVLARLDAELDDKAQPIFIPTLSRRSGVLMRFLAPSAAAAVVVGGLAFWLLSGTAPLALADIVKAAQKHKLVRYREQQITDTTVQSGACLDSKVYADFTAPRLYSESRIHYPDGESVLLSVHDGKRQLTTNSRQKTARLDVAPKGYKSVLCCLEDFQQKKGVAHEKSDLDGRTVVKYRHVEGRQTTTLWVDAKAKLPLRMEQEFVDPNPGVTRTTLVWTDFTWDPELPQGFRSLDALFSTRPPDGYTLDDQTKSRKH